MLTNNLMMLRRAAKEGFAIPAINTQGGNYDIIRACCLAAQKLRSPIILAHYTATGSYSGHDWFVQVARWCAEQVDVPVSIHLDHGDSFETCMQMLRLGFTSLMIDGSALTIEENAAITTDVIHTARYFSVPVEAEVGELLRLDCAAPQQHKNLADPEAVRRFLSLCQPDSLAIGIGNAHGYYRGTPEIRLNILEEVRRFTDIPLVLHGCTGMKKEVVREAIRLGVAKINFGTEIRYKYIQHYRAALDQLDHQGHSWKISQYASDALTKDIEEIILLSGSSGTV